MPSPASTRLRLRRLDMAASSNQQSATRAREIAIPRPNSRPRPHILASAVVVKNLVGSGSSNRMCFRSILLILPAVLFASGCASIVELADESFPSTLMPEVHLPEVSLPYARNEATPARAFGPVAQQYVAQGQLAEAKRLYASMLASDPGNTQAREQLLLLARADGDLSPSTLTRELPQTGRSLADRSPKRPAKRTKTRTVPKRSVAQPVRRTRPLDDDLLDRRSVSPTEKTSIRPAANEVWQTPLPLNSQESRRPASARPAKLPRLNTAPRSLELPPPVLKRPSPKQVPSAKEEIRQVQFVVPHEPAGEPAPRPLLLPTEVRTTTQSTPVRSEVQVDPVATPSGPATQRSQHFRVYDAGIPQDGSVYFEGACEEGCDDGSCNSCAAAGEEGFFSRVKNCFADASFRFRMKNADSEEHVSRWLWNQTYSFRVRNLSQSRALHHQTYYEALRPTHPNYGHYATLWRRFDEGVVCCPPGGEISGPEILPPGPDMPLNELPSGLDLPPSELPTEPAPAPLPVP